MLSVLFADLNHRLGLPPLSLFTVALALTDGTRSRSSLQKPTSHARPVMTITFFFNVSDTGNVPRPRCPAAVPDQRARPRFVARDRADDQLLLHQLAAAGLVRRNLRARGVAAWTTCPRAEDEGSVAP